MPKFGYHWCIVYAGGRPHWTCCKCGGLYRMGDPTAFLFGIQVGPNPVTDIVWYVGHPPTDNDQELLNLLKCINALLTGTLMPSRFAEACTADGVSSFTDEIMAMIRADGLRFLGQI